MEKGMCEGSERKLPRVDEEPTSGSESSEFCTPTMSDPSAKNSTPSSSSSAYQSARIDSLRASRSAYENPVEFEIAASKSHWTDLDSDEEPECSPEDNLKYFQSLQLQIRWVFNDPPHFHWRNLVVGQKIAEGGQAEIYEVKIPGEFRRYVVKVFKKGYSLRSLHRQWPPELLAQWQRNDPISFIYCPLDNIEGAILLNNERFSNRFAFVMRRAWGDLRKHIDQRMLNRKHKRGCPPFSTTEAAHLMHWIASDMEELHRRGILHRDLKASNVLLWEDSGRPASPTATGLVSDFESLVGVVGTGFWRAPEILQQLKDGVSNKVFTTKADVYSFGMTCYEVVTGCTPFEGLLLQDYDHVLSGNQPTLPVDLNPLIQKMICSCWQLDPVKRPSFRELVKEIKLFPGGGKSNFLNL